MKLSKQKRAIVLKCLIEGNSVASTTRITGAAKNTILDLLKIAGEACTDFQNRAMVDLPCEELQIDEIWSFVGCKDKMKDKAKGKHPGDVWTWVPICADTKIVPTWYIGDRSGQSAYEVCSDLAPRLANRCQITTDGLGAYQFAIGANFSDVDYAKLIKVYGKDEKGNEIVIGTRKEAVFGNPDIDRVNTSYVERHNLTIRMQNRRFARKTNAFSKKLESHGSMMALHFMNYNFCRKHMTLKTTPAVAAEVADHIWTLEEVVDMIIAYEKRQIEAAFEEAFNERTFTPRETPKTFAPVAPETPWYLKGDSDD